MRDTEPAQEHPKLNALELSGLGRLASKELTTPSSEISVTRVETGLMRTIDGVYLGAKVDESGVKSGYTDKHETPVPEAGIAFGVRQASYGYTGIYTRAMPGYQVETAVHDSGKNQLSWKSQADPNGELHVTQDQGNLNQTGIIGVDPKDIANAGLRLGVIRVTGPDESVRTYALAADFEGQPDSWRVRGGIAEVDINTTPKIDTSPIVQALEP